MQYGVYRFESPQNPVAEGRQRFANQFHGNGINLADYLKGVGVNTLPAPRSRLLHKLVGKAGKVSHTRHPKVHVEKHAHAKVHAHKQGHVKVSTPARPRIPALFEHGVKTIRIEHVKAHRHR
jgi:hypothetical protein